MANTQARGGGGTKGKMTRILLPDDQQVMRQGLRCLLEREPDLQVVGETSDGLEVIPLVERLKPDVLITDITMPGLYGLEVTRRVRELAPGTGVVVLSRYPNEWYVTEALRRGAFGYVVKQSNAAELLRAVRLVARGRRYLGAPLSEDSIDVWMARAARAGADPYETSPRASARSSSWSPRDTAAPPSRGASASARAPPRRTGPTSCASCASATGRR
jgi:DNA-binding NarL/FixJ family response regulator